MRRDKGAKYVAETKPPERFARNGREKERGRKRETERNASTEGLRETESPPNFSVRSRARFSRGRFRCFDFELGLKGEREKERDSPRRTVALSEEMDRWSAGCPDFTSSGIRI